MKGQTKLIIVFTFFMGIVLGLLMQAFILSDDDSMSAISSTSHGEEAEHHGDEDSHSEEIVPLTDKELEEFGVELATAGAGKLQIHTDLSGEIIIDPDRLAHIVPRFPGVVREVRKAIGDRVKKGEVLAIIESNESLAPYEVTSLIDGTVINIHMTRGELIEDEDHSIVVADLSQVWANMSVYQKDLQYVQSGQSVVISAGHSILEERGKISYVSPVVDEETRTATAWVVLSNPAGSWKPGLFVKGRLTIDEIEVGVTVPKTAIETMEGRQVVFVQTEGGFRPHTVVLGRTNETHVEVVGGLQPGQRYVKKNGFTLKAELGKGAFGEGHGH